MRGFDHSVTYSFILITSFQEVALLFSTYIMIYKLLHSETVGGAKSHKMPITSLDKGTDPGFFFLTLSAGVEVNSVVRPPTMVAFWTTGR